MFRRLARLVALLVLAPSTGAGNSRLLNGDPRAVAASRHLGSTIAATLDLRPPSSTGRIVPGSTLAVIIVDKGAALPLNGFFDRENMPAFLLLCIGKNDGWQQSRTLRRGQQPRSAAMVIILSAGYIRLRLTNLLDEFQKTNMWDHDRCVVVVLPSKTQEKGDTKTVIEDAMSVERALSRKGIFRAIVLDPTGDTVKVLRLRPYQRPQRPLKHAQLSDIPSAALLPKANIYFHGIVVTLFTGDSKTELSCNENNFDWTLGNNERLAKLVMDSLRLRILCLTKKNENAGMYHPNRTWTGLARWVKSGLADAVFFGVAPDEHSASDFFLLQPHAMWSLCAMVRNAPPLPFLGAVLHAFGRQVWLMAAGTLLALAAARAAVAMRTKNQNIFNMMITSAVITWRAFLSGDFGARQTKCVKLNVIGISAALFGYIFLNCFQGSFTSYLSVPRFDEQIDTLEQLDAAVDIIHVKPNDIGRFDEDEDPIVRRLSAKFQSVRDLATMHEAGVSTLFGRHAVLMLNIPGMMVQRWRKLRELAPPYATHAPLRTMPQCVMHTQPLCFAASRESPYAHRVDWMVSRIMEIGVAKRIVEIADKKLSERYDLVRLAKEAPRIHPHPIRLLLLTEAFYILGGGLTAATAVFILEHLMNRMGDQNKIKLIQIMSFAETNKNIAWK